MVVWNDRIRWGVIENARVRQRRERGVVAAAAVAGAVVAAVLLQSVGGGGSRPASASVGGRQRAHPAVLTSCATSKPTALPGAPSESLLSILGVLRRPAEPADATIPRTFDRPLVYTRYIRLARVVLGNRYFVIPSLGLRCKPLEPVPAVMLLDLDGLRGSWLSVADVAAIKQGGLLLVNQLDRRTTVSGLVPDGVATITLHYPAALASGPGTHALPAITITAKPIDNIVAVTVPRSGRLAQTPDMTWRSANGHMIKTFNGL